MLVDKLRERNISIYFCDEWINVKDATIFFINESMFEITKHRVYGGKDLNLTDFSIPSLLPFENVILNYNDGIDWFTQFQTLHKGEKVFILSQIFGCHRNDVNMLATNIRPLHTITIGLNDSLQSISMGVYDRDGKLIEMDRDRTAHLANFMDAVYRFTSFLSCKNITYEQKHPPAKLQKSRAKKGKPPLSSYYVLKLKPTTTKRDYEAKNLWTNRVHLCRGHVREYTEERPLFGKYAGRFWIPPHARGDRKQGVIHKDYQLETTET
jgi:hypothetical protein